LFDKFENRLQCAGWSVTYDLNQDSFTWKEIDWKDDEWKSNTRDQICNNLGEYNYTYSDHVVVSGERIAIEVSGTITLKPEVWKNGFGTTVNTGYGNINVPLINSSDYFLLAIEHQAVSSQLSCNLKKTGLDELDMSGKFMENLDEVVKMQDLMSGCLLFIGVVFLYSIILTYYYC
jgi:hypothetical protein